MGYPVTIVVPTSLRSRCAGAAELPVTAATVREAVETLERDYCSLYRSLCDETGVVRPHVNLFVNDDNIRDRAGLDTPLGPGDMVTILTAVSGG